MLSSPASWPPACRPLALADEIQCRGAIGPVLLDNAFVPDDASCTLDRTRLKGNLVVGRGSQLTARGVSVNGNIQAEGSASVAVLNFSIVGGSVQIVQGHAATITTARINGDLYFDEQTGRISAKHEPGRWKPPGISELRRRIARQQPHQRQSPMQGERAGAHRRRQPGLKQGRPVREAVA